MPYLRCDLVIEQDDLSADGRAWAALEVSDSITWRAEDG
jgi:hypothetical protein